MFDLEHVGPTGFGVDCWWRYHLAVDATNVDANAKGAGCFVADVCAFGPPVEQVSPSPTGECFDCFGECTVAGFECVEGVVAAVFGVDVDNEHAGQRAGGDADAVGWVVGPVFGDACWVVGGELFPVLDAFGVFAAGRDWDDSQSFGGVCQGVLEGRHRPISQYVQRSLVTPKRSTMPHD